MRVIDMFRTPSQQKIIRWLEANHMGTRADIAKATGIINSGGKYYRHFRALADDGVIHICGYVGCKNIPVYALVRNSVRDPSGRSQAQGGVLKHEND